MGMVIVFMEYMCFHGNSVLVRISATLSTSEDWHFATLNDISYYQNGFGMLCAFLRVKFRFSHMK